MSVFNKLAIKNDRIKKASPFFVFMEEIQLPHDKVLLLEHRTFHHKVLSKLYCDSKFNILVNFNFVYQPHKSLG